MVIFAAGTIGGGQGVLSLSPFQLGEDSVEVVLAPTVGVSFACGFALVDIAVLVLAIVSS